MPPTPVNLDGAALASTINGNTAARAALVTASRGRPPTLATVIVGDDPASITYVAMKGRKCRELGLNAVHVALPSSTDLAEATRAVAQLSGDPHVDGILVQHPIGESLDERTVFDAISPDKDVDGVTSASFAAMAEGRGTFDACTPGGIVRLLDHHGIDVAGADAVVVGRSAILGRPMAAMLTARDATVTVCHSRTSDLAPHLARADIVVAAVGRPHLISSKDFKAGAVVIDAGYHRGKIGDVDMRAGNGHLRAFTPVPGGVGPMTIAVLLAQTVDAAGYSSGLRN